VQQQPTRSFPPTSLALPRGRKYDPFEHAAALGLQIIERPIRTAHELWLPDLHTIVIRTGLRAVHKRNAAAHGVAHAALGHEDDRPKHEHQADRLASVYLIDPNEFDAITKWTNEPAKIAVELGVTMRLLEAYLSRSA
jgi:Zn-dependent peptidase ImmA (M78 family)